MDNQLFIYIHSSVQGTEDVGRGAEFVIDYLGLYKPIVSHISIIFSLMTSVLVTFTHFAHNLCQFDTMDHLTPVWMQI